VTNRKLPPLALAYHGVADVPRRRDPHGLFVAPHALRRHIERLRAWGYELVTFGALAARAAAGDARGQAALTFDDGLADNLDALAPLAAEGVAATIFVVSGWLEQPYPPAPWTRMLTHAELQELASVPAIEIGAHSATHPDLSRLDYAAAHRELREGKTHLEELLGIPIETAAYPYGRATEETARAARDAGFRAACVAGGRGRWEHPYLLPRQDMENGSSLLGLRLKRAGKYEMLMRHAPARAVRRLSRFAGGGRW
jgi:peptidoglycan/xylan/chitin deacetylase (PgdA/CDA1 family)